MLNHIIIMGRLTRDPELRRTSTGLAVASFSVAVDRDWPSKDSGEKETDFINCVAWRQRGGLTIISSNAEGIHDWSYRDACFVLGNLLTGACSIERKHWKPKYNERYYSIGTGGVLEPGTWLNDFVDIALYRLGNCYPTPEEASANADKWIKFCESDESIKC